MEPSNLKTSIIFLVSNRSAVAKIDFETIRTIRPSGLYVVSDGPKSKRTY